MKRGDVVLCCGKGSYSSKPRPAVIVQSDGVAESFRSLTLCPITSCFVENSDSFRVSVSPGKLNKLERQSFVMVDKVATYPKESVRNTAGKLSPVIMLKVDAALLDWFDLG